MLLTILGSLPVSTATSERSFSTMRRLKAYLRSSIGNERMTGRAYTSNSQTLGQHKYLSRMVIFHCFED